MDPNPFRNFVPAHPPNYRGRFQGVIPAAGSPHGPFPDPPQAAPSVPGGQARPRRPPACGEPGLRRRSPRAALASLPSFGALLSVCPAGTPAGGRPVTITEGEREARGKRERGAPCSATASRDAGPGFPANNVGLGGRSKKEEKGQKKKRGKK